MTSKLLVTSRPRTETSLLAGSVKTPNGPCTITRFPSARVKARRVWTKRHSALPPTPPSCCAWDSGKANGESSDRNLASNTVRSAPASSSNRTVFQSPAGVSTLASTTGRTMPSSNVCQRPRTSIDALQPFARNVLHRRLVVGMFLLRQPLRFPVIVGNEDFAFRDGDVPTAKLLEDEGAVLGQPMPIA